MIRIGVAHCSAKLSHYLRSHKRNRFLRQFVRIPMPIYLQYLLHFAVGRPNIQAVVRSSPTLICRCGAIWMEVSLSILLMGVVHVGMWDKLSSLSKFNLITFVLINPPVFKPVFVIDIIWFEWDLPATVVIFVHFRSVCVVCSIGLDIWSLYFVCHPFLILNVSWYLSHGLGTTLGRLFQ